MATALGAIMLHVYTINLAYKVYGLWASVGTFLAPFFAEVFWFAESWWHYGTPVTHYSFYCLVLFSVFFLASLLKNWGSSMELRRAMQAVVSTQAAEPRAVTASETITLGAPGLSRGAFFLWSIPIFAITGAVENHPEPLSGGMAALNVLSILGALAVIGARWRNIGANRFWHWLLIFAPILNMVIATSLPPAFMLDKKLDTLGKVALLLWSGGIALIVLATVL